MPPANPPNWSGAPASPTNNPFFLPVLQPFVPPHPAVPTEPGPSGTLPPPAPVATPEAPAYDPDPYMEFLTGANDRLSAMYDNAAQQAQAQYDQAAAALQARREAANQQVAGITPRLNDIYNISNNALTGAGQAMADAQRNAGLMSFMTPEAILGPLGAASAQQRAAQESTVPLLQAGFTDLYDRQRGGLEQARMGYLADLQQQRADRLMGLDERRAEYLSRQQQAQAEEDNGEAAEEREFQRRLVMEEFKAGLRKDPQDVFGKQEVSWAKGEDLVKSKSPLEINALRNTPAYRALARAYNKQYGEAGVDPTSDPIGARNLILETARGRPWDRTTSLFMFDNGIDPVDDGGNPLTGALLPALAQAPKKSGGNGGTSWLSPAASALRRLSIMGRDFW